jgi:hypothetical protein
LLVLAQPADDDWHATLDGERLPAARAYGWAQAWELPAGGGHLVVSRDGGHRDLWLVLQLVVVVVAVLCSLPTRGSPSGPGRRRRETAR